MTAPNKEAATAAALYTTPPLVYKPRALGECANRKAIGGWGGNACAINQPCQQEAQ